MRDKSPKISYRYYQDRATPFYLSARMLHKNENTIEPSAFCAFQAIENILKAALEYYEIKWAWGKDGHDLKKLADMLEGKLEIDIPDYFNDYQEVPRYPESSGGRGSGLSIPVAFLSDLDRIIYKIVSQIPDKGQTRLKQLLKKEDLNILELSENNNCIDDLREFYSQYSTTQTKNSIQSRSSPVKSLHTSS